jgi:light-regulated signal transduction histidine kinase (bacteriophytochrome)
VIRQCRDKIAFAIKDNNFNTLYESSNISTLLNEFPEVERNMEKIIRNMQYSGQSGEHLKRNSNYEINAITIPKIGDARASMFFFIISNNSLMTVNEISKSYHDIQEPIRSISNLLQILAMYIDKSHDSDAKKYITYALASVKSLRELTTDLLARSITKRRDNVNVSMQQIMDEILTLLKYQISMRNCTIIIEPNIPDIYAVKSDVLILFKNLVENSLKHAISNRDLVINIHFEDCPDPDNNSITIIFEDNGEDNLNKQASANTIQNTSLSATTGYGIGTEICYQIAKLNGWILEEELDCYSRFKYRITLPKAIPIQQ